MQPKQPSTAQTHLVIKLSDAQKYLSNEELQTLGAVIQKIDQGRHNDRKKTNIYIVCNMDEPYAQELLKIIHQGESLK